MKITNSEFKRKIQVGEELHKEKRLPILTRRQIAHIICAFFKINDVQKESYWLGRLAAQRGALRQPEAGPPSLGTDFDGEIEITCKRPLGQPFAVVNLHS